MTRMSKQGERRATCPKRPRPPAKKTGSKKDQLASGYREHANAIDGANTEGCFIPKIR
jgi:hypothetical protein